MQKISKSSKNDNLFVNNYLEKSKNKLIGKINYGYFFKYTHQKTPLKLYIKYIIIF